MTYLVSDKETSCLIGDKLVIIAYTRHGCLFSRAMEYKEFIRPLLTVECGDIPEFFILPGSTIMSNESWNANWALKYCHKRWVQQLLPEIAQKLQGMSLLEI